MTPPFDVGEFVVEIDTGRPLRVVSDTYDGEPPGGELLGLTRLARGQVEQLARRRGVSLRDARIELGYKAPPPMWGDGAVDEPDTRRVLVVGSTGGPWWADVVELERYSVWFRRRLEIELLFGGGQLELGGLLGGDGCSSSSSCPAALG